MTTPRIQSTFTKDSDERLDYLVNFDALLQGGESIASHTASATDSAGTSAASLIHTSVGAARSVTVWLTGGTAGTTYIVTVKVTTDSAPTARIFERSFALAIES